MESKANVPQPTGTPLLFDAQQANETVRGWAYRILLENIIHLNLAPGTFIAEQELANILRASRTPIREALIQLANDQFVEITSQRGTRISLIDPERVNQDRFMRMCLEYRIAGLACAGMTEEWLIRLQSLHDMLKAAFKLKDAKRFFELDEEFHQNLCASCGKERIWEVIRKFSAHLMRARVLNINSGFPGEWELVLEQHEAMLQALQNRDAEAASGATEAHLSQPGWDVYSLRERFGNYFVVTP